MERKDRYRMSKICECIGREILDSRGNPTVEAEVILEDGSRGIGMSPSGASTGVFEALELRDGEKERYNGKGVGKAVDHVNTAISAVLVGQEPDNIYRIDHLMRQADGTTDKSHLGANAILAVSIACAKAAAVSRKLSLYQFFGGMQAKTLPVPMMNILNGGVHARNTIDFQEFMIMPVGAATFREGLRMGTEVYHSLKSVLEEEKKNTAVGDEGGFAPALKDSFEVLEYLTKAVRRAGYKPGDDIVFAMDAAASELHQADAGMYYFPGESQMLNDQSPQTPDTRKMGVMRSTDEMIELYASICEKYPVVSIEDPLQEDDWEGWKKMTKRLGDKIQLVGDDLFVTNTQRLEKGII